MEPAHDLSPSEQEAVREFPAVRRLIDLHRARWRITPVISPEGVVSRVDGMRVWPDPEQLDADWVDTIMVLSPTDAKGLRANPDGDVVWSLEGTLDDVVNGLLALPPPGAPGAPRLIKGPTSRLWTP